MKQNRYLLFSLIIVAVGITLFVTGIGRVHLFDWDEINFAESAREMLITGDYLNVQVNFETFWEKPPFFIWLQALSMKIFGVNEFAARFPNAIAGIVTLLVLFFIGSRLKNIYFGLLWATCYLVSFLPFFYFKSGIIDPWFNLFIFLGLYYIIQYSSAENNGNRYLQALLSALFIGMATLTKGPVGLLIFGICFIIRLTLQRFRLPQFKWMHVVVFFAVFSVVGGLWFILQIASGNYSIIQDFIVYQIRLFQTRDAGHGGFPGYHFVILFFGVFPTSVFAVLTMHKKSLKDETNTSIAHFFLWMMITLWVVLILFTVVRTKIVHYSSMCYFPITFLAAWYLNKWLDNKTELPKWAVVLTVVIGSIIGLAASVIPFIDSFKHLLIPYIKDEFAVGNLQASGGWKGFEWIIGLILIISIVYFAYNQNRNRCSALAGLFIGSLIFIYFGMFFFTERIEKYSQNAAIEFFKSKRGEDCYIYPIHKSYAHYFYSERQPKNNIADKEYLQKGHLDKPVYFVVKSQKKKVTNFIQETNNPIKLYEKNGFIFYARLPGFSIK